MKMSLAERKKYALRNLGDRDQYYPRTERLLDLYEETLKMHEMQIQILLDRVNSLSQNAERPVSLQVCSKCGGLKGGVHPSNIW